ncbi:alanyl-tRNA editing protein [Cellulosilyticum sp. I15G10I2]|uniref:alanyl-tRNA editing protein n=1 Tax=Cellulosilyticum sp. I15G10I2 TaxID=1892843 RepID=UPI00085BB5F2|nr:DHHA1 domain-containing protein [Cellulosilyticum sp. I15G10I2]
MQKLYYEDAYKKFFTAEITAVIEKENTFHIELDQTYFYPEGGGQPSDTGFIEDSPISFVYESDGHIYHVTDKKPIKIHKTKCTLNWERRFDYMQQHLGQHILSACFLELFNAHTVGFHLGEESITIDIDSVLGASMIQKAEIFANDIIFDNIPVETLYPSKSELKKLPLKKPLPQTRSPLRLVKIGDLDLNPCCGTHPRSTLEVQALKINKWEKYKGGMRVYFLCGKRAINDYFAKSSFVLSLSSSLKCSEKDALIKIEKLTQDFDKLSSENRKLKSEVADYEVQNLLLNSEKIQHVQIVKALYDHVDPKYITLLASKLTDSKDVIVLFGINSGDIANLIFMCSKDLKKMHMGNLLKDTMTLIDGKGGGSYFSAQGGGKDTANLSSAIDYALMKIKQSLSK